MKKRINKIKKYLEWNEPDQAIAELNYLLKSEQEQSWVPHHLMGIALALKGDHQSSADSLKNAIDRGSDIAETSHMLSVNHYNLGHFEEAEQYGREAVAQKGDFLKAWLNLGSVYRAQAKLEDALRCYQKANQIDPRNAGVAFRIAEIYRDQGDFDKALQMFEITLKIDEDYSRALLEQADVYKKKGRFEEAEECLDRMREKFGENTPLLVSEAELYKSKGDYDRAIELYERLLEKLPESGVIGVNYALCLQEISRFEESEEQYRRAIAAMPESKDPISNYLMGLHYNPENSGEFIFKEHLRLGKKFRSEHGRGRPVPSDRSKDKRLRIGFVSGGFRRHPVGWMIAGALEQLPEKNFELYCYTTSNKFDFVTRRIHENIHKWRSVVGYSSKVIENIFREDELDIIVDLSGHAADNCLQVMANEPAPIILKWVGGLFNTTGIPAFDYLISDWHETPKGSEEFYTEKLVRLPDDYICFTPPAYSAEVGPVPMEETGCVTFGCFNNPTKVNGTVLEKWADIMNRVAGSRLLLKSKQYDTTSFREQIIGHMETHGISKDRVEFQGQTAHDEHLEAYNQVDIALDPWPYSGGLTTCEALYMGVPVITLPGPTFAGRHSATHLHNAGFPEWVTGSWEEYTSRVVELAGNPGALRELRKSLRQRLSESAVCDGKRFGAHLGVAFRKMWEQRVTGWEQNLEEWQDHIAVDPLSDKEIERLTDGPPKTHPIKIEAENNQSDNIQDQSKIKDMQTTAVVNGQRNESKGENKKQPAQGFKLKSGVRISVPDSTELLTPYVLLEQGDWFEPELDFVREFLRPGMRVVDAGAAFGVYALQMADIVGQTGGVYAFEPVSMSREHLRNSKSINGFDQLEIVGRTLGGEVTKAGIKEGKSPEFNTITTGQESTVDVTTLDAWWSFAGQPPVDLVKLDVNGMETDVLTGAGTMLERTSPLMVVSVDQLEGEGEFHELERKLSDIGYRLYEYIPGPGVLADYEAEGGPDPYRLNLIAVPEARRDELKKAGWIFDGGVDTGSIDNRRWKEVLGRMSWTEDLLADWERNVRDGDHQEYVQALNMICEAEVRTTDSDTPSSRSEKGALLLGAAQKLIVLFNEGKAGIPAALTYIRLMNLLGKRAQAVEMVKEVMEAVNSEGMAACELPFLLPLQEQDETAIRTDFQKWLTVRLVEAWILLKDLSTYFSGPRERQMLQAMEGNPEAMDRVERMIAIQKGKHTDQKSLGNGRDSRNEKLPETAKTNGLVLDTPSEVVTVKVNLDESGSQSFNISIPQSEIFRIRNIFEQHEYALPGGLKIRDDAVIVDIGANIGVFALYASRWAKNCSIYCFEPNPQVQPLLEMNTAVLEGVKRFHTALGKQDGELQLHQNPHNTGATSTTITYPGAKTVKVPVKHAGKVITGLELDKIDVLKIDTEGAEIPILEALNGFLPNIHIIMAEYHSEEDRRAIDSLLTGFKLYSNKVEGLQGIGTVKYINQDYLKALLDKKV